MTYGHEGGSWTNDDQRDSVAGQSTETAEFEQQWAHVMGGLDRAVAWIKSHKLDLKQGFSLNLDREHGIEIRLPHYLDEDGADLAWIKKAFAGKQATRTERDIEVKFRLKDADEGITFSWSVYRVTQERPPKVTTVQV